MEAIAKIVATWYADSISKCNVGKTISDIMGGGGDGASTISAVSKKAMETCYSLMGDMSSVGLAIAILFFVMALIELITTERFTLEFFIKFFGKLAVAMILIVNAQPLAEGIVKFGEGLQETIVVSVEGENYVDEVRKTAYDAKYNEIMNTPGLSLIAVIMDSLTLLLINMITWVLEAVVYLIAFTRLLEMGVRGIFIPIAIGLMSDDGWHGAGGRYIKKFLAICSQGAVLVAIGVITETAMRQTLIVKDGMAPNILIVLGLAFASISLMFKSIGIVNDVFGA